MLPTSCHHDRYDDAIREAGALLRTVRLARGLVDDLRPVDLGGLEEEVGRLCARALDLPAEQGRSVAPLLSELVVAIDALTRSLDVAHG